MRIQLPLFEPPSFWVPPKLSELPSWETAKRVAIDIETCDPDLRKLGPGEHRDGRIVGVSFAIEDSDHKYYLPIGHHLEGNLNPEHTLQYLRDQADVFGGILIGQNLQYDLGYLRKAGIYFNPEKFRDVRLAAALLNENQLGGYSLNAIAAYLRMDGKAESGLEDAARAYGLTNPKSEMWKLPARHVAPYAIRDVTLPLEILRKQERRLEEDGLWGVYDLESDVLPIVVEMREIGVRVDLNHLDFVNETAKKRENAALAEVRAGTGVHLLSEEVHKKDPLLAVIRAMGVEPEETAEGHPKIDTALLESIEHPAAEALLRAKRANKIRTTFVESVRRSLVGDRIHASINQMRRDDDMSMGAIGTVSGRFSMTKPNLQQQPSRDPVWGKMWRAIYVPEPGQTWACLDFSSQEPRIATHFAALAGCDGADEIVAAYHDNPRMDFHSKAAKMVGDPCPKGGLECRDPKCKGCSGCGNDRGGAKTIFLGVLYGMGGGKLCRTLGLPVVEGWRYEDEQGNMYFDENAKGIPGAIRFDKAGPEGQELLRKFDDMVPFARLLSKMATKTADKRGYVSTYSGRRRRFPKKKNGKGREYVHKSLNSVVQGSAADQIKIAMVELYRQGVVPLLQVHDELNFSIGTPEASVHLAEVMENAAPLLVPSVVDIELGADWGNIELFSR